ncbi:hypothetical protein JX265_001863 [Neoarthrinium moseri]|uniref:non-specific serine/threonine protein kinase n=1 Tax=Neoarthrinium moseri TaxID=1658444 RepID=A0A9P9WW11_9PEZI|nr:hypothetical protein JX265_001863 [Neoarthrinium moseri]
MKPILIGDKYRVDRKIAEGGAGLLYAGTDVTCDKDVAIKLMENRNGPTALRQEAVIYQQLEEAPGFPDFYWSGSDGSYEFLVFELLGPSLADLFAYCEYKFSLKTILLIADQAIARIERIHRHFLHRDIKPENFLLGTGKQGNTIYAVDFGLATKVYSEEEYRGYEGLAFEGTYRYASINCHRGLEPSWRDDLESLGYVLLYFARGSLPWEESKVTTMNKNSIFKDMKASLSGAELCEGFLPQEFALMIDCARSLKIGEKPDYRYFRRLFRDRFLAEGFHYDNVFDWTERRFHEIRGELNQKEFA